MNKYVVGFLFDNRGYVALISKNRPQWQKGKLNGIGGHIELKESPEEAMVREFREEAGCDGLSWRKFGLVKGTEYELHLFTATSDIAEIRSMTDENVWWYLIECLPKNILPNLSWIIPMANYKLPIMAEIIHESPEC